MAEKVINHTFLFFDQLVNLANLRTFMTRGEGLVDYDSLNSRIWRNCRRGFSGHDLIALYCRLQTPKANYISQVATNEGCLEGVVAVLFFGQRSETNRKCRKDSSGEKATIEVANRWLS